MKLMVMRKLCSFTDAKGGCAAKEGDAVLSFPHTAQELKQSSRIVLFFHKTSQLYICKSHPCRHAAGILVL